MLIPLATRPAQPRYCRCTPAVAAALLLLARLIQRPDHQAAPLPGLARRLIQPGHREPADYAHRRGGVPRRPAEQPLRPVRRPVTRMLGDRPAVAPCQPASQRTEILPRLQPRLRPGETRSQQGQHFPALPGAQARPYPGSRSRLRFCCRHTHMIARRLHPSGIRSTPRQPGSPQVTPRLAAAVCYTAAPGQSRAPRRACSSRGAPARRQARRAAPRRNPAPERRSAPAGPAPD